MSKSIVFVFLVFLLFSVDNVALSQNQKIFVTPLKNADNSVDFKYTKKAIGSHFIQLELENLQNCVVANNVYNINLATDSGTLFKLTPIDKTKNISFSFGFSCKPGVINPKIDSLFTYSLPFKENKKVFIYELKRTDVKHDIWKAYLVYSKTKDTIYAMRKGIVADIKKLTTTSTEKPNEQPTIIHRTEITVVHPDGTTASYTGLDGDSLFVTLGQTIYPQTKLGIMDDMMDNYKNHNFRFNVCYFLDDGSNTIDGKKSKVTEKSVTPIFFTENGKQKLSNKSYYIAKCDDALVFQEMDKKEKEMYKK